PWCGNDSRQWGIVFASPVSPLRPLQRVLLLALLVMVCVIAALMVCVTIVEPRSQEIIQISQSCSFDRPPIIRVELSRTLYRRNGAQQPERKEIFAEAYRWDGEVCELRLSGPSWSGTIVDPAGASVSLDEPFGADLAEKWLEAAAGSQTVDRGIAALIAY